MKRLRYMHLKLAVMVAYTRSILTISYTLSALYDLQRAIYDSYRHGSFAALPIWRMRFSVHG